MKKLIAALMALLVMAALAACSGVGDLKGFLAKAEGDWYRYGNSADTRICVFDEGTWEYYSPISENGGEVLEFGSIIYDSEYKSFLFAVENSGIRYFCELKDGLMMVKSGTFVAAQESRNLTEWFNGNWYRDGDEDGDHNEFVNGEWKFWVGYGSSDSGILMYRDGEKKSLTRPTMIKRAT